MQAFKVDILFDTVVYRNESPDHQSVYAAFPQICHLRNGDIACVFRMGTARYSYDGRYVIVRSSDNGKTWSKPVNIISPEEMQPAGVVVMGGLIQTNSGTLIFAAGLLPGNHPKIPIFSAEGLERLHSQVYVSRSTDGSCHWETPREVKVQGYLKTGVSSKPTLLSDGTVMLSIEAIRTLPNRKPSVCTLATFTKDEAESFKETTLVAQDHDGRINYCDGRTALFPDGKLMMMFWTFTREETSLNVHTVLSHDNGRTWTHAADTGLKGQVTAPIALDDQTVCAVSNYRNTPEGIRLYMSYDSGNTWQKENGCHLFDAKSQRMIGKPVNCYENDDMTEDVWKDL